MELALLVLWLVVAVVAHADTAVQAAREPQVVVALLQLVLNECRVGLLLVLPEVDRGEAEHCLGLALGDRLRLVLVLLWRPGKHGAVLGVREEAAAFREPAERLLAERAHRLAEVAAEGGVREEVVQALAVEALVEVVVEERAVSRNAVSNALALGVGEDARAAVLDQVRLGILAALCLALLAVDRVSLLVVLLVVDRVPLLVLDRVPLLAAGTHLAKRIT